MSVVFWLYSSISAIANRLSENHHESFPDEDWGLDLDTLFYYLSDHKDFEFLKILELSARSAR